MFLNADRTLWILAFACSLVCVFTVFSSWLDVSADFTIPGTETQFSMDESYSGWDIFNDGSFSSDRQCPSNCAAIVLMCGICMLILLLIQAIVKNRRFIPLAIAAIALLALIVMMNFLDWTLDYNTASAMISGTATSYDESEYTVYADTGASRSFWICTTSLIAIMELSVLAFLQSFLKKKDSTGMFSGVMKRFGRIGKTRAVAGDDGHERKHAHPYAPDHSGPADRILGLHDFSVVPRLQRINRRGDGTEIYRHFKQLYARFGWRHNDIIGRIFL